MKNQNWIYMTATNQAQRDQFVPWVSCAASPRRTVSGYSKAHITGTHHFVPFVNFSKPIKLKNWIDDFLLGKYTVLCCSLRSSNWTTFCLNEFDHCVYTLHTLPLRLIEFFENIFDFKESAHTTVFPTDYRIFARINSISVSLLAAAQKSKQEDTSYMHTPWRTNSSQLLKMDGATKWCNNVQLTRTAKRNLNLTEIPYFIFLF